MAAPAPGSLAAFQDAFARALLAPERGAGPVMAAVVAQPGFAVYRNTVMKSCVDALQANYPAVRQLVGDEWFRAAAAEYVRGGLPAEPTLLRYGAGFADFLARFEPTADLPYLPGVAQLDRRWTEAHTARDEEALDPAALARFTADELADTVLHPHAAARWAWFPDAPIYTIWRRNRSESVSAVNLDWDPEGALLTRPGGAVAWAPLDAAGCAFLDACAAGESLAAAAQAALHARGDADISRLMATLLKAGAFGGMSRVEGPSGTESFRG
jgi:hypothetical protein